MGIILKFGMPILSPKREKLKKKKFIVGKLYDITYSYVNEILNIHNRAEHAYISVCKI